MAALTQSRTVKTLAVHLLVRSSVPCAAATTIYAGSFIGLNGSVGRALVAGDKFLGLASESVSNGSGSAGDLDIPLHCEHEIEHAVTGVTGEADRGKLVYASDDNTLTLTATNNSLVGVIQRHVSSTTAVVRLLGHKEIALS